MSGDARDDQLGVVALLEYAREATQSSSTSHDDRLSTPKRRTARSVLPLGQTCAQPVCYTMKLNLASPDAKGGRRYY